MLLQQKNDLPERLIQNQHGKKLYNSTGRKGLIISRAKGMKERTAKGTMKGWKEEKFTITRQMETNYLPANVRAQYTDLIRKEIKQL